MALLAGVRQAEPWSTASLVAGVVLVVVFVLVLTWVIRRYLDR